MVITAGLLHIPFYLVLPSYFLYLNFLELAYFTSQYFDIAGILKGICLYSAGVLCDICDPESVEKCWVVLSNLKQRLFFSADHKCPHRYVYASIISLLRNQSILLAGSSQLLGHAWTLKSITSEMRKHNYPWNHQHIHTQLRLWNLNPLFPGSLVSSQ